MRLHDACTLMYVDSAPRNTYHPAASAARVRDETRPMSNFCTPTRREFLGSLAAVSLFPPLNIEKPDLILHNAKFFTVDDLQPSAQAVAIANSRFLAVGSNSEIMNLAPPGVKKIDLCGKT